MTRSSDRKEYFFNKIKSQMLWFNYFLCTWNLSFYLAHVNYSCWIFSHCKKNSQNSPYSWCYIQLLHIPVNDVSDIKNIFSMEGVIYSTFELLILIKTNLDYLWTYFFFFTTWAFTHTCTSTPILNILWYIKYSNCD